MVDKYNNINNNDVLDHNDYNEKSIELFKKFKYKTLPKYGWMQYCFYCGDVTSNIIEYRKIKKDRDKYIINVYLCKLCEKYYNTKERTNENYVKIKEKINNFLKRHNLYYCDDFI